MIPAALGNVSSSFSCEEWDTLTPLYSMFHYASEDELQNDHDDFLGISSCGEMQTRVAVRGLTATGVNTMMSQLQPGDDK